MKKHTYLSAALLAATLSANAQTHEIGVFGEKQLTHYNPGVETVGVQYKKWKNDRKAIRLTAGYAKYYNNGSLGYTAPSIPGALFDTRQSFTKFGMAFAGAGLDWQWRIVENVYWYAGLEGRLGYGRMDSYTDRNSYALNATGQNYTLIQSHRGYQATPHALYAGLAPIIGAKVKLKHVYIGTEFSNPTHFVAGFGDNQAAELNLQLNQFNGRLYISYRF